MKQDQQKMYYDRSAKWLSPVYPGNPVRISDPLSKAWEPGVIKDAAEHPRSYVVDMQSGSNPHP